jgi:sugar lactone lactonase YvrE
MKYILTIALSCFLYANTNAQSKTVQKLWQTDSVFKVPESVLFHAKKNLLYVSNIDGKEPWGKDGVGSIGKLNTDGSIINIEWVKGLNAPKGMGIHKGKLYVADLTEVVVIDIKSGTIQSKIAVAGAERLNDISINKKGVVYVSDSKARRVYSIEKGNATILLDSFSLKGPNGVLAHKNSFYVLDNGGLYKLEQNKTLTKITDGMDASTDGVAIINKTDFIVSCWSGIVYYVSANGTKQVLIDGRNEKVNSADIGFDAATNTIFVPTFWRNTVAAYRVN